MLLAAFRWLVYSDGKGWLVLYLSLSYTHTYTHTHTVIHTVCSVADILLFSPLIGPLGVVRGLSGCLEGGNTYTHIHSLASGEAGDGGNRRRRNSVIVTRRS